MKKTIYIILGLVLAVILFFTFSYLRMLKSSENKAKQQTRDVIEMQQAEYEREQKVLDNSLMGD